MMLTGLSIGSICLAAGLVQGLTGFGSALVAIPLLCLFIDIKLAVPLSILNSVVITGLLARQLRGRLDSGKIAPLTIGALPGIAVGATLLKAVDAGTIRLLLGLLLIFYGIYGLRAAPRPRRLHRAWAWAAGFCSGAIGAAFSAGGPPAIIYTTLNGGSKDEIKATLTGFFLFTSCLSALVHGLGGITTTEVVRYFLIGVPFVLAGTIGGSRLYRHLDAAHYVKLIFLFLLIMGMVMVAGS